MRYDEEKKVAEIIEGLSGKIEELTNQNREMEGKIIFMETEIDLSKPLYSRRKLEENFTKTEAQLSEAIVQLQKILGKYVELAASGDCGFWNPEKEDDIIECRAFIKRILGEL